MQGLEGQDKKFELDEMEGGSQKRFKDGSDVVRLFHRRGPSKEQKGLVYEGVINFAFP